MMFSRGKNTPGPPSEAQARDKLVVYVYEYLTHMGAKNAADSFLTEINWSKGQITANDPPGFLYSWWCVFWDLYCAAPERREIPQFQSTSSKEAISFHEYQAGVPPAGYGPLSPGHNGMAMPPLPPHHSQQNMGDGGPGLTSSPQMGVPGNEGPLPPGFFPGHMRPGPQMMSHGGMMHPPSNMHPGHPGQGQGGPPPGQNQGPPPPGHMTNGPPGQNPNSPHPGMMGMQGGGGPFMGGPRGPFPGPGSNRSSPATRMGHPSQQQMEFGPPPGSMIMSEGGMVMGRGGMGRGGMPSSPMAMPPGGGGPGYGGGGPPMQRMSNPNGSSPSNSALLPGVHQQQSQRAPWHSGGGMGHYSTPSPPNGNYMGMMGPPPHMQSPSHDSVMSGGADGMYGMMKAPDRFGHNMNDPSMNPLASVHEMAASINGEGMEMKHSPGLNGGVDGATGRNNNSNAANLDSADDPYSINQFSAAASASGTSSE